MPRFDKFNHLLADLAKLQDGNRVMHKSMSGETVLLRPEEARKQVERRENIAKANTLLKALVDRGELTSLGACKYQAEIHRLERGLI
ncbi:hypothetical protein [Acidisphaera sp. S103]|uniref:hypothetical protein n=1 Tax=Acidisphaera sp. S103 TaxID=1747223 RepID=UPI00131E7274|nr:hypothetical protein [Acidisphaera sp. S103]